MLLAIAALSHKRRLTLARPFLSVWSKKAFMIFPSLTSSVVLPGYTKGKKDTNTHTEGMSKGFVSAEDRIWRFMLGPKLVWPLALPKIGSKKRYANQRLLLPGPRW